MRGRNRHGFPPRATLTVACSSRQRLSAPCIRMGFCLPLASHCAVLTAPNSWAIPSTLAFDGEEGCTAVSHATVVGKNRAMQATMGCSGTVLPAKCRAALEGCARREVVIISGFAPPPPIIINHPRIRHSRGLNTACEVCKEYKTTLD